MMIGFFKESALWADAFYKSICPYDELSSLTLVSFLSMLIYYDKKESVEKLFLAAHSCRFVQNGTMDVLYHNNDFLFIV